MGDQQERFALTAEYRPTRPGDYYLHGAKLTRATTESADYYLILKAEPAAPEPDVSSVLAAAVVMAEQTAAYKPPCDPPAGFQWAGVKRPPKVMLEWYWNEEVRTATRAFGPPEDYSGGVDILLPIVPSDPKPLCIPGAVESTGWRNKDGVLCEVADSGWSRARPTGGPEGKLVPVLIVPLDAQVAQAWGWETWDGQLLKLTATTKPGLEVMVGNCTPGRAVPVYVVRREENP